MFYRANINEPNYEINPNQGQSTSSEKNVPDKTINNVSGTSSCLPNGMPFGTTAMQEMRSLQEMQDAAGMHDMQSTIPMQSMTPMPEMMYYCPMMYGIPFTPDMYNQMMPSRGENINSPMESNSTRQQGAILPFLLYGLSGLGAPLYGAPYYNPYFPRPYYNPYFYNNYYYNDYDDDYDDYDNYYDED